MSILIYLQYLNKYNSTNIEEGNINTNNTTNNTTTNIQEGNNTTTTNLLENNIYTKKFYVSLFNSKEELELNDIEDKNLFLKCESLIDNSYYLDDNFIAEDILNYINKYISSRKMIDYKYYLKLEEVIYLELVEFFLYFRMNNLSLLYELYFDDKLFVNLYYNIYYSSLLFFKVRIENIKEKIERILYANKYLNDAKSVKILTEYIKLNIDGICLNTTNLLSKQYRNDN